ncbi:MAG: TRAP transporter permease [Clostridia bacterium]|nr:TRAP transporter permease [Clostridia bacterium]
MLFKKKQKTDTDGFVNIDVNELVEKRRSPAGLALLIVNVIAFCMTIFQLYCAGFKTIDVMQFRTLHTAFGLCILFLIYPMFKGSSRKIIPWYDWILAVVATIPNLYVVFNFKALAQRAGRVTTLDLIMGLILIVMILEGARRVLGKTLVLISCFFIFYTLFGSIFPGALAHRNASLSTLVRHMILSTEGVFGVALGASASFIFLFCLLGALMAEIKADSVLIDLAVSVFGKQTGGPAKAAVVSSALFGTISGSSLANVTTTGTFTIPLMKKVGYEPEFAGAVEATASTGGQIMPPVMGAAAFIIAEFVGTSYLDICIAAALPALLYFTGVFTAVHVRAKAKGLRGIPKEQLPNTMKVLRERGYLLLPLVSIIVILVMGMSPSMAAFIACLLTIAISFIRKETRFTPKRLFIAFANGAKGAVDVMIACAVVGFIIGSFSLSGLGVKMATLVNTLAGGSLFLTLLFSAIASILLGMGVPTTANYIMMSMITVPAVVAMGVNPIAAHLFCFYFGIVSDLTPPVALAALTGAGIAKAKFWPTAINATKLGIGAYLVPFFFVFNPILLLGQYDLSLEVILAIATSVLGIICVSSSLFKYFRGELVTIERLVLLVAGLMMISPKILYSAIGLGLLAATFLIQKMRFRKPIS